jgi:hypothetical protein
VAQHHERGVGEIVTVHTTRLAHTPAVRKPDWGSNLFAAAIFRFLGAPASRRPVPANVIAGGMPALPEECLETF